MRQPFWQQRQQRLTELDGRTMGEIGKDDVFQLAELVFDGVVDFVVAVAEKIAPPGTDDVDVFFAFCVIEIAALAVVDDDGWEDLGVLHLLGRMPDVF